MGVDIVVDTFVSDFSQNSVHSDPNHRWLLFRPRKRMRKYKAFFMLQVRKAWLSARVA